MSDPLAAPAWQVLGYQSQADFDVLANAVDCALCRKPLPQFARFRVTPPLEAPAGGWPNRYRESLAAAAHATGDDDLCICATCNRLVEMGRWPVRQTSDEVLQGRLFDAGPSTTQKKATPNGKRRNTRRAGSNPRRR